MILFNIGLWTTIIGVAGIEGTIPLWVGFLTCTFGVVCMFCGVIRMAYQGSDYLG